MRFEKLETVLLKRCHTAEQNMNDHKLVVLRASFVQVCILSR